MKDRYSESAALLKVSLPYKKTVFIFEDLMVGF